MKSIFKNSLVLLLLFSLSLICMAEEGNALLTKTRTYVEGEFNDVSRSDWYYDNVVSAYEYGIMSGTGGGAFNPSGNMKISEAIAIAARISNIAYNKGVVFEYSSSEEWYEPYIRYIENYGIVPRGKFSGRYDANINRGEFVYILSNCVGEGELTNENPFSRKIPDMNPNDEYYSNILKTVKAGIISGKDADGNFYPRDNITRAEAAAVIDRVVDRTKRKSEIREIINDNTNFYDKTEYYMENSQILNYGNCNEIYSIFSRYSNVSRVSLYGYLFSGKQMEKYFDKIKENGYKVKREIVSSEFSEYAFSKKGCNDIIVEVLGECNQIWIYFEWEQEYEIGDIEDEATNESSHQISLPKWDKSDTYLENAGVKNYGALNNTLSLSRKVVMGERDSAIRYTYEFEPIGFLNYYIYFLNSPEFEHDALSLDSNALYLDYVYRSRSTYMRLYIDFVKNELSVEFPKKKDIVQ